MTTYLATYCFRIKSWWLSSGNIEHYEETRLHVVRLWSTTRHNNFFFTVKTGFSAEICLQQQFMCHGISCLHHLHEVQQTRNWFSEGCLPLYLCHLKKQQQWKHCYCAIEFNEINMIQIVCVQSVETRCLSWLNNSVVQRINLMANALHKLFCCKGFNLLFAASIFFYLPYLLLLVSDFLSNLFSSVHYHLKMGGHSKTFLKFLKNVSHCFTKMLNILWQHCILVYWG